MKLWANRSLSQTPRKFARLAYNMNRFLVALLCVLPALSFGCTQTNAQTPPIDLPRARPGNAATAPVSSLMRTRFDERGLVKLSYNGANLLDVAASGAGAFSVGDVHFVNADGTVTKQNSGEPQRSWDDTGQTLTLAYDWGRVICRYEVLGDRLNLNISVANDGKQTLAGVNLFPLMVQFRGFPDGFDATTPHVNFNLDGPTVQSADFGAGRLTVVNREVTKPLAVGFISTNDTGQTFRYHVYVGSAPLWYQPDNWPKFTRPIAPGARDSYPISLRFSAANVNNVGEDVLRAFAAAHPMTLNWSDRRPIGSLFLASAADNHPSKNPRGWFYNAPDVDVTTDAGRAQFRARVLNYARESVRQIKAVGAQGMITWDIEGQQYPHSTSYIGDPRLLSRLAPEMDAVADDYFRVFTDAGLKVGVCVRPQRLTFDESGEPDQKLVADEAAILIDKIAYAQKRWGATLIYVDSNGGPYDPSDAEIFRRVAAAFPDALLMPEHQNLKYQAVTAPYNDLRFESSITPDEVRVAYPRAFSVMKGEVPQLTQRHEELVRAVRAGDILVFNGWYESDEGKLIRSIYAEAKGG